MNTKVLWGLVVIIIIGLGAYFFMGHSGMQLQGGVASTTQNGTQAQGGNGETSLSALVYAAQPVSCSVSITNGSATVNGVVYIGAAMMRGDFTSNDPKVGTVQSHMIVRDSTSYVWTDASDQGFKSTVSAGSTASPQSGSVDYNAPQNYKCQPWVTDLSKFDLPGGISFMSTASYTPPAQGAGATGAQTGTKGTAQQCGACYQLSGAQKAQCLAALQC